MDYHRPLNTFEDNPKVHIALVLVPGKHSGDKEYSTSPLLLNPGGPGGSGVGIARAFGHSIQSIIDEEQDVIGFDPRGIGATTPRADCFSYPPRGDTSPDNEDYVEGLYHRFLWVSEGRGIGLVNSSSVALQKIDTRARAIGKLCQTKDALNGKNSILRYSNTPNVARDMLSIIDAWDEWTDSQRDDSVESQEPIPVEEETESITQDTKGKLVYWGFSYGVRYTFQVIRSPN